jgi:RimJ/RimL family protein N-acetyltransferase
MSLFEGQLVRLTQLQRDDLPLFRQWFRDYEFFRLLVPETAVPITDEAEDEWYEHAVKSKESFFFAIRLLADGRLIGSCGLFDISPKNRCATFGIAIGDKDCWGKGFGTDATQVLLRFAFQELNLNRVQLEVFAFNQRAIRAYEKIGFVHEGVRRQALFREGRYHDVLLMAILREEWLARQG